MRNAVLILPATGESPRQERAAGADGRHVQRLGRAWQGGGGGKTTVVSGPNWADTDNIFNS